MNVLQYKFKLLFAFVLYTAVFVIYAHFPAIDGYFLNADEGTYYRQALRVNEQGVSAFNSLTNDYARNEHQEQLFPNPLRVGHISMTAAAVYIDNSIRSLSYLSLFFYALLCVAIFYYCKNWFGEKMAAIMASLVCVSPLLGGLSARALSDLDSCFFHTLTLLTFIQFIRFPARRHFVIFITIFTINILVKETGAFFIPFYAMVLLYAMYYKKQPGITRAQIAATLVLPGLLSGIIIIAVLGIPAVISIIEVVIKNNVAKATIIPYVVNYNSGPWYLYIIDYILVSPLTALFALLFIGNYIIEPEKQLYVSIIVLYLAYFMLCYNFLPKNVRYAIPMDIVIRIIAVLYLAIIARKITRLVLLQKAFLYTALIVIMCYDVYNYNKFFVKGKIYDPVSYELLRAEKIIPK